MKLDPKCLDAVYPAKQSPAMTYVLHRREAQRVLVRALQDSGLGGVVATKLACDALRVVAADRIENDDSIAMTIPAQSRRKAERSGHDASVRLTTVAPQVMTALVEAARRGSTLATLAPLARELLAGVVAQFEVPS